MRDRNKKPLSEEVTFTVTVQALGRIAIPKEIRHALKIDQGDLVTLTIRKVMTTPAKMRKRLKIGKTVITSEEDGES